MAQYQYETPKQKAAREKRERKAANEHTLSELDRKARTKAIIICIAISAVLIGIAVAMNIFAARNGA